MEKQYIGEVRDFPEGEGTKVEIGNKQEIAVFNVDGDLYAVLNKCLHMNLSLHPVGPDEQNQGEILEDSCSVKCPWHGMEWSLESGHNPVTNKDIPTYDLDIDDGDVYLLR